MLVATASWFRSPAVALPDPLDDVRQAEYRFLARKTVRQVFQDFCQRPNLLLGNLFRLTQQRGDQCLAFDKVVRLSTPAPVADLRVVVRRLAGSRDLVRRRRPRRVALDRKAHLPGRFDNRRPALRPVSDQVVRYPRDPRELSLLAVLFHADAEALLQAPGQGIAVDCPRRLHPGVDRVLMQRPVLAVPVCTGGIENHTMSMKLRIVVPAGAMLEHRGGYVSRQDLDIAVPVTDAGIGAMAQHRLLQRHTRRIVMSLLDLRTQLGIGDGPQGGNTLVSAKGQVETRRAPLTARVLCEFAPAAWGKAVVQPVEVAAVDLAAVGKTEQALRIEPDAVGFLTRRVVLIGMTERALALQVISGRCRLGQGGYHDASLVTTLPDRDTTCPECSWIMTVVALMIPALEIQLFSTSYRNGQAIFTNQGKLRYIYRDRGTKVQRCEKAYTLSDVSARGYRLHERRSRGIWPCLGTWRHT